MVEIPEIESPTIAAIWKAREDEAAQRPAYKGYGISASALGTPCDRQLWYGLRWASPPEIMNGRKLRIFERGDIEEQRVVNDLRRAGLDVLDVDEATGKQFRFSLANGWLRGKTDGRCWGVLEAPKAEHVLEIKSAKAADWRAIKKHGLEKQKPEHWHQLHIGMGALDIERGLYVCVNKDTEEILVERVRLDRETIARQEARVLRIVGSELAPPRYSDDQKRPPCLFCQHKAACHEAQFTERNCRTCLHFNFTSDGNGHCDRFNKPLRPGTQQRGGECPAHLFLPDLVPGEQTDADPEAETVTYRMPDGAEWIDGARND